ncbi:uncharacterized protein DEA37_0014998 [Paragonimus westermani]|uniref:Uncharacterized protein n=1 Tax=Paragonimus westermani TaxID=34504 RepID=A0A5J4NCL0_9TREM|nr:uncharacterized protein DEA37_0014998 [Paragonimus westermani]
MNNSHMRTVLSVTSANSHSTHCPKQSVQLNRLLHKLNRLVPTHTKLSDTTAKNNTPFASQIYSQLARNSTNHIPQHIHNNHAQISHSSDMAITYRKYCD